MSTSETDCDHTKVVVDTEDGPKGVCPVCDDVRVETLDGGDS